VSTDESRSAIQTFSGTLVDPFDLLPEQVHIKDIAHALGNQCRFGGHCRQFYSVAQHSCLLADLTAAEGSPPSSQLWALLHDAAEAYLVDLPRPLKHSSALGAAFRTAEQEIQAVIRTRFDLRGDIPPGLEQHDRALLAAERLVLMAPGPEWTDLLGVTPARITVEPWTPAASTKAFLQRFRALTASRAHAPD
jgi:5'-nucleotidase